MTTGELILAALVVVLWGDRHVLAAAARARVARPTRVHAAGAVAASSGPVAVLVFLQAARRRSCPAFSFTCSPWRRSSAAC